ncbi:MAG: HemK2/MTQ2 family protein methyltransferase [archaeon]
MIYEPSDDSYLLEKYVKKFAKGKSVLDIGSGSGIQAMSALNAGASSVLASDINPEVISFLKERGIPSRQSNLFEKISGKFDLIVFNPPYLPEDKREDKSSKLTTTGGKKGDEIILRFLGKVRSHLNGKGVVLLLLSSLTPKDKISLLLKENGFKKEVLEKKNFFMESLEVWKISS